MPARVSRSQSFSMVSFPVSQAEVMELFTEFLFQCGQQKAFACSDGGDDAVVVACVDIELFHFGRYGPFPYTFYI